MNGILHQSGLALTAAAGLVLLSVLWKWIAGPSDPPALEKQPASNERSILHFSLAEQLPECVFSRQHSQFKSSLGSYWSKQQRELVPACIVQPRDEKEVSTAVKIIKNEFDSEVAKGRVPPQFAIRSGGHSTIAGASTVAGGVVIDLSLFNQVQVADDRASVLVGTGARWGDVSRKLDGLGLAVSGGRNSDVRVGGLTLGGETEAIHIENAQTYDLSMTGGYSYFSPQSGFVCDNVLEYRIVLASGSIKTASEYKNSILWRALKGGSNNFGIVTSFRLRAFPCTKVWSGFLYMFSWKAPEVMCAFHQCLEGPFDEAAGGPLLCISYVQQIGMQAIATHLMYTKPQAWPTCWQGFKKIGRVWSSTKVRTLTSTTDELDGISPAGFRQLHISTTVKNDLETLEFAHATYKRKIELLRKVKGMVWTLVIQPLHLSTMKNGKQNVFGLHDRKDNLVIVLFTCVWERKSDDDLVNGSGEAAIREINNYAAESGTADKFRYLNWCADVQHPFRSYGEENLQFLLGVSKQVDPDGFFQRGCIGGHKLSRESDTDRSNML